MKHQLMLLLIVALLTLDASARIEAPDHVIYGNVTVFGEPAAPGQLIQARLLASGEIIAEYELGRDQRLGDQFALRFQMDTVEPRIEGRARPGDPVSIFIGDVAAAETIVGAEGVAVRLDIDPQDLGSGPSLTISEANATVFEGNAGLTDVIFPVSLNTTSEENVVLFWQTEDVSASGGISCTAGVDYLAEQNSLTLPPGQMQGSLMVSVCGDTVIEPTETFRIRLNGVQGGVLAQPSATATIIDDDDVPTLRIANVTVTEPAPGTTTQAVFRPRLSKNSDFEARFAYQTVGLNAQPGVDFEATSGELSIAAGELEGQITVPILHAPGATPPKSFQLQISEPFNLLLDESRAIGLIEDPGFAPAVVLEQDVTNGSDDVVGLAGPTALALSPDGEHAYVTSEALNAVLLFARNSFNGRLSLLDRYDSSKPGFTDGLFAGAIDVVVSPDGEHVYVAAREDDSVLVLNRNTATGQLAFVQNRTQNADNPGLDGVRRLQLSADGGHVYAAGSDANAIAVFARNAVDGTLQFLEAEISGVDDEDDDGPAVEAMTRPSGLTLSADGEQLYVASRFGDAVQVFNRDNDAASEDYGRLSFVTAYQNGLAGIVGLDGAFDIVASADNAQVYVTAEAEDALVLFDRNADGSLSQRTVFSQELPDLPGLGGVQGLALAPDGLELFAAGLQTAASAFSSAPDRTTTMTGRFAAFKHGGDHQIGTAHDIAAGEDARMVGLERAALIIADADARVAVGLDAGRAQPGWWLRAKTKRHDHGINLDLFFAAGDGFWLAAT